MISNHILIARVMEDTKQWPPLERNHTYTKRNWMESRPPPQSDTPARKFPITWRTDGGFICRLFLPSSIWLLGESQEMKRTFNSSQMSLNPLAQKANKQEDLAVVKWAATPRKKTGTIVPLLLAPTSSSSFCWINNIGRGDKTEETRSSFLFFSFLLERRGRARRRTKDAHPRGRHAEKEEEGSNGPFYYYYYHHHISHFIAIGSMEGMLILIPRKKYTPTFFFPIEKIRNEKNNSL